MYPAWEDRFEDFCYKCQKEIVYERISSFSEGFEAFCGCTKEAKEEVDAKIRYDFKNGCRDKAFKQPTIGDLLRLELEKNAGST